MAVVSTTIICTERRIPFTKPPDALRQNGPLPRAMVCHTIQAGTLDAKPVNDQQELQLTCLLDPTFAYRFVDFNVSLIQDVANDWQQRGYIEIQNGIKNQPAGQTQRHVIALEDARQDTSATEMILMRDSSQRSPPMYIIQAALGTIADFNLFATNQNAAVGAAGTIDALFSFFEYEIEQVENVAMFYASQIYTRS